jgi:hypothetical protein
LTSAEHPLRLVYDAYQYFWYRDGVFSRAVSLFLSLSSLHAWLKPSWKVYRFASRWVREWSGAVHR